MRSKGIAAVLIMASLGAATACSSSSSSGSSGQAAGSGSKQPVTITDITSLSGPLAPYETYIAASAKAAVAQVNSTGGVLGGRKLQLTLVDDGTDPTKSVNDAQAAVNASTKPDIILPGAYSATTVPILPVVNRAKIFNVYMATSASANNPAKYPYSFGTQASSLDVEAGLAQHLKQSGISKVAIATADDETGHTSVTELQQSLAKQGITLTGTQFLDPATVDATAALSKLQSANPQQLLVLGISGQLVGTILKGRAKLGWTVPVITDVTATSNDLPGLSGGQQNLKGVTSQEISYAVKGSPQQQSKAFKLFTKDYLSSVKNPLTLGTMQAGWTTIAFIAGVLDKAGSTDPAALVKAAESITVPEIPLWWNTPGPQLGLSATNHQVVYTNFEYVPAGPRDDTGSLAPAP